MQEQIERDLKAALLAGDKLKVETLRSMKNAILYETVSQNLRDTGLSDEQTQKVLIRESKKRAEAAELYEQAKEVGRAAAERSEKAIIDGYLPAAATEEDVAKAVNNALATINNPTMADMGKIMAAVRGELGATADGALVAQKVKEALNKQ